MMRSLNLLFLVFVLLANSLVLAQKTVHVWEKQELSFTATNTYKNAYTDVDIWVNLEGPGFKKRIYGFWDGGQTFRLRLVADHAGTWTWKSGSSSNDPGLSGKSGSFTAIEWTDAEKTENPLRRGFLKATANQHALEYADGTPFFIIGDTWWSLSTKRFPWYDDDKERQIGAEAGFKDYVRIRKAKGFNWISIIAAFPNWITDDQPWRITMTDSAKTTIRSAWLEYGTGSAKNMENEGGRPFFFPGKVPGYENKFPNMDRINPDYFKYFDRKVDYLNAHGFISYIEVSRRDASMAWFKFYKWPESYTRFMQYIFSRYQANNTVLSPIHLDAVAETVSPKDYNNAIDAREKKYGKMPFGTLLSANASPSTYLNWGDDSWITLHQIGNKREHDNYWLLTEIFNLKNPKPALNGEPYYAGYKDSRSVNYALGAIGGTERDDQYVRSGMYGSFLSGGLAGHVYGAEGIWGADIEPAAPTKMWEAFQWKSGTEMQYLKSFAFSVGKLYQELVPIADLVSPNKTHQTNGYEGWAYCARTADKGIFLAYFEKGCPISQIRGAKLNTVYRAQWFDPRNGTWQNAGSGKLTSSRTGFIKLPDFPGDADWGLSLKEEKSSGPDFLK